MSEWTDALPSISGGDVELRHGYTLGQVNNIATNAVQRTVWQRSLSLSDRLEAAYEAIVEHLYTVDAAPTINDLFAVAWKGMQSRSEDEWHTHGVSRASSVYDGAYTMRNFCRYWFSHSTYDADPENRVIERMALQQIWAQLTHKQQQVLLALAAHDDHSRAAAAVGYSQRGGYSQMLCTARRTFLYWWHEGEEPSKPWGSDRRSKSGNKRKTVSATLTNRKRDREKAKS